MYDSLYYKVNVRIKNRVISKIITCFIYLIVLIVYKFKIYSFKEVCNINYNEARRKIENISSKPINQFIFSNKEQDKTIDLSIVIPAYNAEKYLERCLFSVINQKSNFKYEIIVINDGSIDRTAEILEEFKKNKLIKIIEQENRGFSGARNTGIDFSTGKFIMFVDSDDILLPNSIDTMLKYAYKFNVDIVQGGYEIFDENTTILTKRFNKMDSFSENKAEMFKCPGYPWGKIYKRELFNNVRFPVNYWFEDTIIPFVIFGLSGSFMTIPDIVYGYRNNLNGITNNYKKDKKCIDSYWVVEEVISICKKNKINCDYKLFNFTLFQLSRMLYSRIVALDEDTKKNIFILACDLIEKIRPASYENNLSMMYKDLDRAFKEKNYHKWILISRYISY